MGDHPGTPGDSLLWVVPIQGTGLLEALFSAQARVLGSLMVEMIKDHVSHLSQVMWNVSVLNKYFFQLFIQLNTFYSFILTKGL